MGKLFVSLGGGGGVSSDELTATLANVLAGTTVVARDTNDEIGVGTMKENGAVNPNALGLGETYSIPEGHHNGGGKVSVKSLATLLSEGSIASQSGGTYKSNTSNQTIPCKNKYMTSDIVIEGDNDLKASNIAKGVNILGVTGTYYGNKKAIGGSAVYGSIFDSNSSEDMNYEESFTLPSDGIVYYGGFSALYYTSGKCTCEIYKNGTLIDSRNINSDNAFRGTMFNQSFTVSKGDVVKVKCTATSGNLAVAGIQAVIIY